MSKPTTDELADALRELVRLKDLHDRIDDADKGVTYIHPRELADMRDDYRENKPKAWDNARPLLARYDAEPLPDSWPFPKNAPEALI